MHLLGIGHYEQGVTTKDSLQIKDQSELPDYYQLRKLRTAQRRFFREVKPLLQDAPTTDGFMAQCDAVMEWVELKQLEEDYESYSPPTEFPQATTPPPPQNQPSTPSPPQHQPSQTPQASRNRGRPKKVKARGRPRKKHTERSNDSINQDEEIMVPKEM